MNHPFYLPLHLPPRKLPCRYILRESHPGFANFSYCSPENMESLTKICYTLGSPLTGCRRQKESLWVGQNLFQNTLQEMNA